MAVVPHRRDQLTHEGDRRPGPDDTPPAAPQPIFVLGISQRSGTNFLGQLLGCHADCVTPSAPVYEDHLLRDAGRLLSYSRHTANRWPRRWGDTDAARTALERGIGRGLVSFLAEGLDGRRVVSKTPSVDNLPLYPRLFPSAHVLVLVRDGRAVTESLVQGFRMPFERAARLWRHGARTILRFQEVAGNDRSLRYRVVRYEDLVEDFEATSASLLDFLDLDPDRFDVDAARRLPVFGSSFSRDASGQRVKRVVRTEGFRPVDRFASWDRRTHERFNWVAGAELARLGYEPATFDGPPASAAARHLVLDALAPATRVPHALRRLRHELPIART